MILNESSLTTLINAAPKTSQKAWCVDFLIIFFEFELIRMFHQNGSIMFDPQFFGVSFTSKWVAAQVHHWRGKVLPVNWTEVELEVLRGTQKPPDVQTEVEVLLKRTATEMRSWMDAGRSQSRADTDRERTVLVRFHNFNFYHFESTTLRILPQHFNFVEALIFERCWGTL